MNKTASTLALALLLVAPLALAQGGGREELRAALGDYYAHVVTDKLELDERQAEKLRPKLDDFLTVQQESRQAGRQLQRRFGQALRGGDPDPDEVGALLAEVLDTQEDGQRRLFEARRDLLDELKPAQQARFLLSEAEYRRAVMRHLRELRAGREGATDQRPEDSPWRQDREVAGPRGPAKASSEQERRNMRENLTLLMAFQLKNVAELPLERVVELLPRIESLIGSQIELGELERQGRAELEQALASGAKKSELASRVEELVSAQERFQRQHLQAKRALVETLEPVAAARFLHLQERFQRDAPKGLRAMQRMMSGEAERPERGRMRDMRRRMRDGQR